MKTRGLEQLVEEGRHALERGKLGTSIQRFNAALKLDRRSVDAHFHLGLAKLKGGGINEARFHARKVLKINPYEPNARLNLGVIEAALGKEFLAIRNYNRELKRYPQCYEAHFNLGLIYTRRRRWKCALKHLLECWKHSHPGKLRDEYLALAAQHTRDIALEERIYLQRLAENPQDLWALNNLGVVRNKQGRHNEARCLFQRELEINPADRIAKKNLKYTPST
jgi:tetratricopeptide (TPR) repeat protein